MIGTRLGQYEVTGKLGQGGMGEVYRATDSRLRREVAIKVLPAAFTADRERLARFEREAQLLAQLQHPNIAAVHGLEEANGTRALVMELVEGEDLAARIARGALPLDEALPIARQMAEALEAAHEQGIVHRDLKPANVKVRPDGTVKVLDFGLAKAMEAGASVVGGGPADSPTLTGAHGTQLGMILGTAAYMAPEQARGKPLDRRADIWAFGVVLHEMLTGRRLFAGEETSDVLAAVLRQEVDWSGLPADTPPRLRRLLARCLERDPRQRLRDIGEARVELARMEGGAAELSDALPAAPASARVAAPRSRAVLLAALPLVAALAAAGAWLAKPARPAPRVRLSIPMPPGERVTSVPAISPDGRTVAYAAGRTAGTSRLYVRDLDDFVARPVDSSHAAKWPFFSPDAKSVAFFSGGQLWRASVAGGAATAIAPAPRPFGGTWGPDGIVYAPQLNAGLWRVPAEGGTPARLTATDGEGKGYAHVFPQALPGGEVLFTFWGKSFYVARLSPATGEWRPVTPEGRKSSAAVWSPSGHLLRGDGIAAVLAARWTPDGSAPVDPDSVVLTDVQWIVGSDRPWLALAENGTAALVPGKPVRRLVWVDRSGVATELSGEPDLTNAASLSRDGRRVAYNGRGAVWVRDLATGARSRIVSDITWAWPSGWLPDDRRIAISSNRSGDWDLYTARADGGGMEPLLRRPDTQHPMAVAPDGTVVFLDYGPETGLDLWTLSPAGEAAPLVVTPAQERSGSVSPDGRWLAYVSDESGRDEVYAVPMAGGERRMISVEGGTGPVWTADGRELLYRAGDDLTSLAVLSTHPLRLGERRRLLDVSDYEPQYFQEFAVSADGQRFLFLRADPESRATRIDVILDWFPELAAKVGGE